MVVYSFSDLIYNNYNYAIDTFILFFLSNFLTIYLISILKKCDIYFYSALYILWTALMYTSFYFIFYLFFIDNINYEL